jgi:hypothetical protein
VNDVRKAELRIVQIAIQAHEHLVAGGESPDYGSLRDTIENLIFICPECNSGGHTCPGDGVSIPHGASDCGQHDDKPQHAGADGSCPDYGSTLDPCPPGCASGTCVENKPQDTICPNCAPLLARVSATRVDGSEITSACVDCGSLDELKWFKRTWLDVRTGDTVKLPGTENTAYVRHAVHQGWHVDPRSSEYRPVAMEWTAVHVELTQSHWPASEVLGVLDMDPAKPILIQLTQLEVDAIELLGGWLNRVGMIMTEVPKP